MSSGRTQGEKPKRPGSGRFATELSTFLSSVGASKAGQESLLLGNWPREDVQRLLLRGDVVRLEKADILIGEGEENTALYILLEGELEVLVPTKKEWLRVAVLGPGSVVGEMSFLDNFPRGARVVATMPCSVSKISREAFENFGQQEPAIALRFMWEVGRILAYRLRRMEHMDAAETAREEERKALAAELHDETMQELGSLAVEMAFLKRQAAGLSPELESGLDELRSRLKSTDRRLREIVLGIFPPALALRGLVPALTSLLSDLSAKTVASPHPLEIELRTTGFGDQERLPEEVEIGVYRVIQQGVANVVQHARARKLSIEITWTAGALLFSLSDDGVGFDVSGPKARSAGHFGLGNMRNRVERLLGTFEMVSQVSAGTTLRARVPLTGRSPRNGQTRVSAFSLRNEYPAAESRGGER